MISQERFGLLPDGRAVTKYIITNSLGEYAEILDYGATLHSLVVFDRDGALGDVLLGVDDAAQLPQGMSKEGSIIGRCANRIRDAHCVIDGKEYFFEKNPRGEFLHSGSGNYAHKFFSAEIRSKNTLRLSYTDIGEAGFDGLVQVVIEYSFDDSHALDIRYRMTPERTTILNPTNHAYFNLGGRSDVRDDRLRLFAAYYAPKNEKNLPIDEARPVAGTPYDFRQAKRIAERIEAALPEPYLRNVDDYYSIDGAGYRQAAELYSSASGRAMQVWTDFPALVLFVPDFCDKAAGKGGLLWPAYGAVCLECQYMTDAIHLTSFEIPVFRKGQALEKRTTYRFSVETK